MSTEEFMKKVDMEKIAREGNEIYQRIKDKYEPKEKGKYLAIEIDSENAYMGNTGVEAMKLAKNSHPDKVFFILKIGFDAAETLAGWFPNR